MENNLSIWISFPVANSLTATPLSTDEEAPNDKPTA